MESHYTSGSRLAAEHHKEASSLYSQANAAYRRADSIEGNKALKKSALGNAERLHKAAKASAAKAELAEAAHEAKKRQDRGER